VRATLTASFKQYEPVEIEIRRGLFVGPPTLRNIVVGQRLDQLASQLLGSAAAWREIAQANNIDNPRRLTSGSAIVVPSRRPGAGR
jgi:nucleoid-associated protein YgaU